MQIFLCKGVNGGETVGFPWQAGSLLAFKMMLGAGESRGRVFGGRGATFVRMRTCTSPAYFQAGWWEQLW